MFSKYDENFGKQHEKYYKQVEEVANLKSETIRLSEDNKELKQTPNKFSWEHIVNEVVTITSETPYNEDHFDTKIQAKFDKSDHDFEQQE